MTTTTECNLPQLAEAAFRQASRKVIERARQTGTPVLVWRDGAIRKLYPDDLSEVEEQLRKKS